MSRPCEQFAPDWELFELGALEGDRDEEMRSHVRGCTTCAERYREAATLLASLAGTLAEEAPPAHVEQALRRKLADSVGGHVSIAAPRAAWRPDWRLPAIAAALLACVSGGLLWSNVSLRQELAARRAAPPAAASPAATARPDVPPATAVPPPTAAAPPPAASAPSAPSSEAAAAERAWREDRRRLEDALADAQTRQARAEAAVAQLQERLAGLTAQRSAPTPPALPATGASAEADARTREQVDRLAAEVRRLEAERLRQSTLARDYARALESALDTRSKRVALTAIDGAAGDATASAILTPEGRLLLMTQGLPDLGPDKCYQLWVIRRSTPAVVSGGVLASESSAVHTTRVEGDLALVTGFAITDEPAGGSAVSRGRKLLFGALRQ